MTAGTDRLILALALPEGGQQLLIIDLATGARVGAIDLHTSALIIADSLGAFAPPLELLGLLDFGPLSEEVVGRRNVALKAVR